MDQLERVGKNAEALPVRSLRRKNITSAYHLAKEFEHLTGPPEERTRTTAPKAPEHLTLEHWQSLMPPEHPALL